MSRVGKKPVVIPSGVTVEVGDRVRVKGPKGELSSHILAGTRVAIQDGEAVVSSDRVVRNPAFGTMRAHIQNMVLGVTQGFSKTLEIVGTGYRVTAKGGDLEFALGFSHPVPVAAPDGIPFRVEAPTRFVVEGIDKQKVGEVAANIRKLRKPDPYKGKGVRYAGEHIRRKVGKAGK